MIKYGFYKFRNNKFLKFKFKIVVLGIIIIIGIIAVFPHFFRDTYVVTIANKRIIKVDNIDEYVVYTQMEDGNVKVFRDANSFVELKFNSEDVYWALRINRKYEVTAYGFGIPSIASYQNIIKVKGLDTDQRNK